MESSPLEQNVPLWVDVEHHLVWKGAERLRLTPKACAVLQYLMVRREHVVTKGALLDTFWPDPAEASEAALTTCIREIRRKLRENAAAPHYIETVYPRRQTYPGSASIDGGYRFIGPIAMWTAATDAPSRVEEAPSRHHPTTPPSHLVGRDSEFARLYRGLQPVLDGQRQVLFVTGEPGIGKTTLVNAFVEGLHEHPDLWIARGQCIALYGDGEAYLPILEAFGRLGRDTDGEQIRTILDRYAPTWLAQMPILLEPQELPALLHRVQGATQPRMLREIAEALEILTAQRALLLWLEDLQWSDVSTLQLLAWLALRTGPARLYILGTFRPPEVGGPLAQMVHELHMKGRCWELSLQPLHNLAVAAYLATRLGDGVPLAPQRLGRMIAQRTEGNPLFMVHIVNYLATQGWLGGTGEPPSDAALTSLLHEVPSDIEHLIETQVADLPLADQRLLEVASLAGADFSTAAVAAAGELAMDEVEERCAALARRGHFLQESGMDHGPDPAGATRYRFVHALYQDVLSRRVPPRRRIALHRRLGAWEEQVYDGRTAAMAAELAVRFTHAHDVRRAIGYRQQAAETAMQRSAYHEALTHITHGLDLLQELPDVTHRLHHELRLRMSLGPALIATRGYAAPEVRETYAQAQELCRQCPDSPYLFPVLFGVWGFHLVRAEYPSAHALAHQLLHVAQRMQEPGLFAEAHGAVGVTAFYLGDFVASHAHLGQSVEAYDAAHHGGHAALYGQDPWVASRAWEGQVLWVLGYPEQALRAGEEALACAEAMAHPFSMVFALFNLAMIRQFRGESAACHAQATRLVRLSEVQGFPFWAGPGAMLMGWAMADQGYPTEGAQHLRDGLAMRQAMGPARPRPYFAALLAEVSGRGGNVQAGLDVVMEALKTVAATGERWCEAELYRLQGELLLQAQGRGSATAANRDAEACFQAALALARQQQAKAWELRTTLSVSRLWARQGKKADARELLGAMHSAWPEAGKQIAEWQAASQLLAQWA